MNRQYNCSPHRPQAVGKHWRVVGVMPIGSIARVDSIKIRIEAWYPREIKAWRRSVTGWDSCFVANGMWQALCTRLHDNRRCIIADHRLLKAYHDGEFIDPNDINALQTTSKRRCFAVWSVTKEKTKRSKNIRANRPYH